MILKIGKDQYRLDDWKCDEFYSWDYTLAGDSISGPILPKYSTAWVKYLLTINDRIIERESESKIRWPRLEIVLSASPSVGLYFDLVAYWVDYVYLEFSRLQQIIYPFPQLYTPSHDFEEAKRHCDRFVRATQSLGAFF